jgi:ABC-type transport system involved in cytochrome c biogenesis permease subunit
MRPFARWAPLLLAGLSAVWILSRARSAGIPSDGMDVEGFGRIPVVHQGRVVPLDSFARTQLRIVSEAEDFKDKDGRRTPAVRWLLDTMVFMMGSSSAALSHPVFKVIDPQVMGTLELKERQGLRYAIDEFKEHLTELEEPTRKAEAKRQKGEGLDAYDRELMKLRRNLSLFQAVARLDMPHVVPPSGKDSWRTVPAALEPQGGEAVRDPRASAFVGLLDAYARKDAAEFNRKLGEYLKDVGELLPSDAKKARFESVFNRADPFNASKWLYLAAFLLTFVSWMGAGEPARKSAFALLSLVLVVHTVSLVLRIWISGRPPVTNLYSSAVFVGWGVVLFGLVFERIFRLGVGSLIASAAGFLTLQIAHVLAADGDTMQVLQAVLDTQFWLSTHVTCISLGYAATYVAGLIGIVYVLRGLLTKAVTPELRGALSRMIYGTVCFATFFSFVGTVLGGLWADDSWGRFWGWDPKENGALMIVLWNALILHARWGGLVRERGLANLAIVGNAVTTWSWFGVNELSVGLHTYGFTEGRSMWIAITLIAHAGVVGLGMLHRDAWASPDAVREGKEGAA